MAAASDRIQRVAVGLIWSGGRVLVGVRPEGSPLAGCDEFPGGKCRVDETPEAACARECAEETGLQIEVGRLRLEVDHHYPHAQLHLFFFDCVAREVEAPPRPPFRWAPLQELSSLRFPPANAALLATLGVRTSPSPAAAIE